MSVNCQLVPDKQELILKINGGLGNKIQREFRKAYENNPCKKYTIDLAGSSNIDSSGLGMLLLLRDFAGGEKSNIEIINCSDHILEIFHVTCFYKLFKIPQYNRPLATNT